MTIDRAAAAGIIAASIAGRLGPGSDPLLMAVLVAAPATSCRRRATGATPWSWAQAATASAAASALGAPLSLLVLLCGVPLTAFFWPLR